MIYYQFVLRIEDQLPMIMKTKYRSYDRAIKQLQRYFLSGQKGCMITMSSGGDNGYGFVSSREF